MLKKPSSKAERAKAPERNPVHEEAFATKNAAGGLFQHPATGPQEVAVMAGLSCTRVSQIQKHFENPDDPPLPVS